MRGKADSFLPLDYKKTLFKLIEVLRKLKDFAIKLQLSELEPDIEEIIQKLAHDSFSLAVVGEFKRGKSTFLNALLGADILPSDVLPTTAAINRVTYGLTSRVKLIFRDGREEFIEIAQLKDYVTQLTPESEQTALQIQEAIVYYPVSYCRNNNLDLIDTPGLSDQANLTRITLSVLPQVDAAIFVTMAQSPLSTTESNFLTENLLTQDLGKVIFVITGIDLCQSPEDITKVIQYVKKQLQKIIIEYAKANFEPNSREYQSYIGKIGELKVFGVSANQALQGKVKGDEDLLKQSRFPAFEASLKRFLEQERGIILLQVPTYKAIAYSQRILQRIDSKNSDLLQQQQELEQIYQKELARLKTQEDNYRQQLSDLISPEILKIQEQKVEQRVKRERAKVLIEIEQKKLPQMTAEIQEILAEVYSISDQLRSVTGQICYSCSRINRVNAKFCIYCGTQISCPNCNAKLTTQASYCSKCGQKLKFSPKPQK